MPPLTPTSKAFQTAKQFWDDWDIPTDSSAYSWRAPYPSSSKSKTGGGSKAKKDRNRNGTSSHHKKAR